MTACPRCIGGVLLDDGHDLSCLLCGYVPLPEGFVPLPLIGEYETTRRRRRSARLPTYNVEEHEVKRKRQRKQAKTRERAKLAHERFIAATGGGIT